VQGQAVAAPVWSGVTLRLSTLQWLWWFSSKAFAVRCNGFLWVWLTQ